MAPATARPRSTPISTTAQVTIQEDRELALRIAELNSDSPATSTLVIDIHEASSVADFFVLCTGENERQLQAVVRMVSEGLAKEGIRPIRTEGIPASGWILMDFGNVVLHIMSAEQRAYYRLEELWNEAQTVLSIQ
ncbi:MAG: ribosome silencing factor [Chloroflexota bacterium]